METILKIYDTLCSTPSDINEHLPVLNKYSKECQHITEMGTRKAVSSYAFLAANPRIFITYDLHSYQEIDDMLAHAKAANINAIFKKEDTRTCTIEQTDLLFIDTWHVYDQLLQELNMHNHLVNKYIIMHDTISYRNTNEGRNDDFNKITSTGMGLWPAIEKFLTENSQWELHEEFKNNNGLTILKRVING